MMKIRLAGGFNYALIDDEDYKKIKQYSWCSVFRRNTHYVSTNITKNNVRKTLYLHRIILDLNESDPDVDHINGNGLDCQKSNLRLATQSQNSANRSYNTTNKLKLKGVSFDKDRNKFRAQIQYDGQKHYLGLFETSIDAAIAYNKAAIKYFGEFAWLNQIEDVEHRLDQI